MAKSIASFLLDKSSRQIHQALEWRNRARYEGAIDITPETAKEIVKLAETFLKLTTKS